ncbi:hypothetical protein GCK72_003437 [Caenorhabditis remanei]|uniref:PAN-3 domain-containing protein n=1 Tax=Caenorhabditis remanei TaxID=31234 RepID=A0A6A5HTR0_CAERE|nr:hypothetical protein GCK72_003437 [Caenorhabditis remanei]KAF1771610.1 hypothetical protein GCK72_003437 [Caenorhabditis remanei]
MSLVTNISNLVPGSNRGSEYMYAKASSWDECMWYCHGDPWCFVVQYMDDQSIQCRWWSITVIFFLYRTEAQDMQGAHMAIKIPLSPVSCKYTTEQLLDDKYYASWGAFDAFI